MERNEQISELRDELKRLIQSADISSYHKNKAYFIHMSTLLELATEEDKLNFTTLFSRLAYAGTKYKLKQETLYLTHTFRKAHERGIIRPDTEAIYEALGRYICCMLMKVVFGITVDSDYLQPSEEILSVFYKEKEQYQDFKPVIEAVIFEVNEEQKQLLFFDEDEPEKEKIAIYDIHDRNELFNPNVLSLIKTFTLPIHVNFIDTNITLDNHYLPTALVIKPDHLLDVTSISECFKTQIAEPFHYLINKFKPSEATIPLMVGNLVNFILDELSTNPETTFKALIPKLFRFNPMGFAILDDEKVRNVLQTLQAQFANLRKAIVLDFKQMGIDPNRIFLEPSFYSRDYGIQGRLDLLHQKAEKIPAFDIIELKSGKTFKPNAYGINSNHYIQTLMYDLMIKSTFHTKTKSFNYILYSKEEEKTLRYAPPVRQQQYEAMKLRNDLIAIEEKLRTVDTDDAVLRYIKPENFEKQTGYALTDIINFHNIYYTLSTVEKAYFSNMTAFIAREHGLAKTGEHGIEKSNGHSALWLETEEEKKDRFALLSDLKIIDNQSHQDDAYITFARSEKGIGLVNFRVGDIGVLYPSIDNHYRAVLKNQIFKCTITELTADTIIIRLRSKQNNQEIFTTETKWNIEQDTLDSGFNSMYKNLFTWAAADETYRQLILGQRAPTFSKSSIEIEVDDTMTQIQKATLEKVLTAQDYFLLWGPPGTGKTSIMLKNLVKYLHQHTDENILLLAYTNRAVDEICDAVLSIDTSYKSHFLRLGSRTAAGSSYRDNLLEQVIQNVHSRQEILDLLQEKRIFISTVSSIVNKPELFRLKQFDTVIIDEASQILEPMLCGLLASFRRFILIGDHKQLPAVVAQSSLDSRIKSETLQAIGITDARSSLFERMYLQCINQGWTQAYSIINEQGRMHQELMEFVNTHFYDQQLKLLPGLSRLSAPILYPKTEAKTAWLANRKIYINTPADSTINWKTNLAEAEQCIIIIEQLFSLYQLNHKEINSQSIGIITPYRAQIALIRKCLERLPVEISSQITIDTVERYQGGARDIIILSFCINKLSQLATVVSLSQEGIDRKLNVALTRAREQIILIGNEDILRKNETYGQLLDYCVPIGIQH
ncbi:MAG: AAA family ATPase [Chitinophagales bacterium]|nr:AAA family ATPase [Chitinophagales bacterium]